MGEDLFKGGVPVGLMKDHPWHSIGRDLDDHCFLAAIFSGPHALHLVFEDGWRRENGKVD
jgi:hypothetical protein